MLMALSLLLETKLCTMSRGFEKKKDVKSRCLRFAEFSAPVQLWRLFRDWVWAERHSMDDFDSGVEHSRRKPKKYVHSLHKQKPTNIWLVF